jgi:hypothetical protein
MCKSIAIYLFPLEIMKVIIDNSPNISGALVSLLSSPFSNILGIRLVPKKDDLFSYFLFFLGKCRPHSVGFRSSYIFVMDPVRLKRRHTRERWEMRALCANRSRRMPRPPPPPTYCLGLFLFLLFVPFTFSWLCISSAMEDIHLIFTFILLLLFLSLLIIFFSSSSVCLGYTRGKKPIDTRWSEPASVERNESERGVYFLFALSRSFANHFSILQSKKREKGSQVKVDE